MKEGERLPITLHSYSSLPLPLRTKLETSHIVFPFGKNKKYQKEDFLKFLSFKKQTSKCFNVAKIVQFDKGMGKIWDVWSKRVNVQ
jgi:hypothetical protein